MRFVAILLVITQLIVRTIAVPHGPDPTDLPGAANHSSRPHVHLAGHSHSHATHSHSHHHCGEHNPTVPPGPMESSHPEHDQDVLYFSDVVAVSADRGPFSERFSGASGAEWCPVADAGDQLRWPRQIGFRGAGPPCGSKEAIQRFLPHLLRV